MNKKFCAMALLLIVTAAVPVFAQEGGPRRGGARQGQMGALRGRAQGGAMLLFRQDVQADLQLTNEQKDKLDALRQSLRGGRRGNQGERPTREEMQARRADQQKQIQAILTPEQTKRLEEIQIQLQGDMAVANPDVQTKLSLTADQKTKILGLQEKYREAMQSVRDKAQSGELDRQQARATMEQNAKVLGTEIRKLLTAEQSQKLAELGGKPFKADAQVRR